MPNFWSGASCRCVWTTIQISTTLPFQIEPSRTFYGFEVVWWKCRKAGTCYYSVLGICKQASASEIRDAYRRQALKWHPDRWIKNPNVAGEAKKRFQQIQEAYSVLSDKAKRKIYDAGMLGLLSDDDDEGFLNFLQEMVLLMQNVRPQEGNSLEDLQGLLKDMMAQDERCNFGFEWDSSQSAKKRARFS